MKSDNLLEMLKDERITEQIFSRFVKYLKPAMMEVFNELMAAHSSKHERERG